MEEEEPLHANNFGGYQGFYKIKKKKSKQWGECGFFFKTIAERWAGISDYLVVRVRE